MLSWILSSLLIFTLCSCEIKHAPDHPTLLSLDVYPKVCKHGLVYGPGKKFAVFVFCDDGMGTNIGIINTNPGGYVGTDKWDYDTTRFWWDHKWARAVENIMWSEDGLTLTIKTSPIYGTGKKYTLDLARKEYSEMEKEGGPWSGIELESTD